ncbi:Rne/Rng family ribonuclease [Dietzia sp. 179-F 9C3 NHS]|uniref:Rne/Rng family ribonuclease n=1 Tax=Dietzia sp. 179-F 9C3 NHS TaxID=3374295 RepID=UPI00387A7AEE
MSDPTLTIDDLTALPEKMRAHAAAKAVGMTSKEFLAAMSAVGVEIKSAQSSVTRDALISWFSSRGEAGGETTGDGAAPAAAPEPAAKPDRRAPAKKAAGKTAEKTADTPAAKAPAKKTARKSAAEKTAEKTPAREPLPEAIVTGEVGTDEGGGRRRRSSKTPSFSPLFLSPDESQPVPAETDTPRRDAPARDEAAAADDSAESAQSGGPADDGGPDSGGQPEGGGRRRRRGRRGRGRGRGESSADEQGAGTGADSGDAGDSGESPSAKRGDAEAKSDAADDTSADDRTGDEATDGSGDDSPPDGSDGTSGGGSSSRRRRRRRRRSGSGSGSDDTQGANDDPPHTEIHEREPRRRSGRGGQATSSDDEVQGITGSTRLEAKRQRRRDGREAGRRRQPILSEAEFLARRESVDRVMVVREKDRADGKGIMTQVGVLEDKVLVEHFVTTESARSMVGNVYLGRVQNVLPSMEAAFVDIGRGRNGVLYAGEVNWEAAGLGGKARRIEQALKPGDMVLVQVTKDPVGQKGARLSTQISLAGRFLVYVPDGNSTGISRKLPDTERRRLKAILKDVVPEGSGVIIRTAAEGVSEEEIGRDVERLAAQWAEISEAAQKRTSSGSGSPIALYEEPDLLVKVVRDLFNEDFSKLVIQGETSWTTVHDYVSRVAPDMVERLERHETPDVDVFGTYRVDEQLAKALDRKVWLPSGGSLVIDRTEAMTVIDVNTGKYTGSGGNLEETVTKNNLEAAEEIVRQLRLRDVGGMVIVDFIDMVLESNRDLVLRRLTEALGRDRTRHQVSEVTSLGLVQLTRKKLGTGLVEAFSTPCEHCQGRGLIVHADPIHTESHNADEPGSRRGRRRGGRSSGGGQSESQPALRKGGPAPSAHPAALAMQRNGDDDEVSTATATTTEETAAPASGEQSDAGAGAVDEAARPEQKDEQRDEGTGRPRRRRRSSRRTAGEGADTPAADAAVTPSTEDVTAAPADAEPAQDEAAVVAEAAEAVETVTEQAVQAEEPATAAPVAEQTPPVAEQTPPVAERSAPARRPRRRSTRREAGAAAPHAVAQQDPAPVAAVAVEAATLAEAPTAVVAEPRRRPARRRATRPTVAPEDAG